MISVHEILKEVEFIFSRSSGPGGQNVNKLNTKAELRFDIVNTELIPDTEKELIIKNLEKYINSKGILRIVSERYRSQLKNKEDCIEKFSELLNKALKKRKKRVKTRIPNRIKMKRKENKKIQSEKKKNRKKPKL